MSLAPLASRYLPSSLTSQLPSLPAFGRSQSTPAVDPSRHYPSHNEDHSEILIAPVAGFASGRGTEPRLSTLLPSITCSSCGIGLRMEELGEHVCTGVEGGASQGHTSGSGGLSRNQLARSSSRSGGSSHRSASHLRANEPSSRSRNRSHGTPVPTINPRDSHTSHHHHSSQPQSRDSHSRSIGHGPGRAPTPVRSATTPVPVMSRDTGYERREEPSHTGHDSGMAGVGRRQFGADQSMKPFAQPPRPLTPPHALFSNPPTLPNVPAQNQSQPYFIASHSESFSYPQSNEQDRLGGSLRPGLARGQSGQSEGGLHGSIRSPSPLHGDPHTRYGPTPPGEVPGRNPSTPHAPRSAESSFRDSRAKTPSQGYPRPGMTPFEYEQSQRGEQAHRRRPSAAEALKVDTRAAAPTRALQLTESYANGSRVSPDKPSFERKASSGETGRAAATIAGSWKASASAFLGHKKGSSKPEDSDAGEEWAMPVPPVASKPQPVAASGGGDKLPFFERYRQMTDGSAPGSLARSLSNSSFSKPGLMSRGPSNEPVGAMPAVFDDLEEVDSPVAARLEVDEELSSLPWARESMSKQQQVQPRTVDTERKHHHGGDRKKSDDGSMSSLDQATAEKLNVGQMALLTPSASMDELDPRSQDLLRARKQSASPPSGRPRDREPLRQYSLDEGFLSPNASYPGSRRGSDKQYRDSSASSLLAPSDSISTPGISPFPGLDVMRAVLPRAKTPGSGKPGRTCQKCGDSLKGKRYIERDGISLCERDWKDIYLPKCRRCKLPIETSAVSSSDGQLRGKWHRECFTCTKCDQPFDGETFYVHGDKPYCQMHYHQANGTLCASSSCQQPIEGPCLLTSANQRYHPGHLRCSHRESSANGNQRCADPMNDYFEIGRLKVCERHKEEALRIASKSGRATTKAEKRKTRLIDT